jgi:hypothetical protein
MKGESLHKTRASKIRLFLGFMKQACQHSVDHVGPQLSGPLHLLKGIPSADGLDGNGSCITGCQGKKFQVNWRGGP